MDPKMLGIISAVLYFVGGAVCLFGDAMGGTKYLQGGVGLYFVGRGLQALKEVAMLAPPHSEATN